MTLLNLFATTPKGLELLLVDELRQLGATHAAEKLAGVEFTGSLEVAYRACLWSRLANRILLRLAQFPAATPEALYAGIQTIPWDQHMDPDGTLAVHFVSSQSEIDHTLFGAQKVKDAIVDQFREKFNKRPSVAKEHPDLSVNVYLYRDTAAVSIDLSGDSLHQRNYRLGGGGIAPLKENLAAALLIRAGWPAIAKQGGALVDPMSGSGALLIEAAMIAGDVAPGLARDYFGFLNWKQHQPAIWEKLIKEATVRREQGIASIPPIIGYDKDPYATKIAFENIARADLLGKIHVEKRDIAAFSLKENLKPGLVIVNPPYGERIGEEVELQRLYELLGDKLKGLNVSGDEVQWRAAIFTGNPELAKQMGIRARKYYSLFNGALACQLLLFDLLPERFIDRSPAAQNERRIAAAKRALENHPGSRAEMFVNRVQKNLKHIKKWAERENISCYRIYDADLPEYAFSIDVYGEAVYVQEYPAPKSVDSQKALQRQQEVLANLPEVLCVAPAAIFFRVKPRRAPDVGEALDPQRFCVVQEADAKYAVNLYDATIDTGLSLRQRQLRQLIRLAAQGAHFLNLFATSGAMTVSAALGGALTTKTVAETAFHFNWVKQNLALNNLTSKTHHVITTDPLMWFGREKSHYHCVYADIPEIEPEDHELLIYHLLKLLSPEGVLFVTTQDKQFKINPDWCSDFAVEELTFSIAPPDFSRGKMVRCWKIS